MENPIIRFLEDNDEIKYCAEFMAASEPWITLGRGFEACRNLLSDTDKERYLAEVEGQIAGVVVLSMRGAFTGYIQAICIAPEFRGRRIGSLLIQHAEKRIFNESPNVFICVSEFNKGAMRLYERLGYEPIGALWDYIVSGQSEVLLRKTIGPIYNFKAGVKQT